MFDECCFEACLWEQDCQRLGQEWRVELEKLGLDVLAHVRRSGRVCVEVFDMEFHLVQECLDSQSDGVVVSRLGKMLFPRMFGVQQVLARLCE